MKFDWWLTGICFGRALSQTVPMVYAAALPVLQREWEMSAAKAGAISSGYQIGKPCTPTSCCLLPTSYCLLTAKGAKAWIGERRSL